MSQTNENKVKTYEEKIEAAAKSIYERISLNGGFGSARDFRAGVQWCRENPPPEFQKLTKQLEIAKRAFDNLNESASLGIFIIKNNVEKLSIETGLMGIKNEIEQALIQIKKIEEE